MDRAALDVALELKIPCGGWCPCGRRAEDGVIPAAYPLVETPTANYFYCRCYVHGGRLASAAVPCSVGGASRTRRGGNRPVR